MRPLRWMLSAGMIAAVLAAGVAPPAWGAGDRATPAPAPAAAPTATATKPKAAKATAAKAGTAKANAAKTGTAKAGAAKSTAKPSATTDPTPARDPAGPRTLDEITIEGEIPVPQVLFITARDQRRFLDLRHHRYLKNSQRVGETTVYPSWISVAHGVTPEEPRP